MSDSIEVMADNVEAALAVARNVASVTHGAVLEDGNGLSAEVGKMHAQGRGPGTDGSGALPKHSFQARPGMR